MDPDFLHAINGDWDALLAAMRASRSLVHRADASGMSVLHWVCLHQDVPTDVVVKVVFANPHAARLRNDAGHLPLDLALQAECSERVLEILRAAHDSDADRDEPTADDDDDDENDFGRSYFHDVRNGGGFQQPVGNGSHAYNNHHTTPTSSSYQQQQQQLQQQYYHQQERQGTGGYGYESPHQQQPHHHHGNYFDEPHHHHQQHQQMVMYGDNSYRHYPEDDDDDDDRYTGRLQHQPHYANERLDERNRQRGRSHSSGAGINPMLLTEQRLQQREHDLISYATDDPHADHHLLNPMFDPSANARRPPVLDAWQNKGVSDAAAAAAGTGSAKNFKPPQLQSSSFPPRWKQARHCHVCLTQFSFTKRRHHCRNCGQSVCGSHSTNRVALPKFALLDPQRLCDKCFLMGHFLVPAGGSGSFGVESLGSVPSSHHTATTTATVASTPYRPQPSYNSGR